MISNSKTIPIKSDEGLSLDMDSAKEYGLSLSQLYGNADPFPHIAIDDFLPNEILQSVCADFPKEAVEGEVAFEREYTGLHKRQISPYDCPNRLKSLFLLFNSAPMLGLLEELTSIQGLIPDPYYSGGGLHETRTGGRLGIHSDFRINKAMHLERRINVIIYLNENWKDSYGGNLELWNPEMTSCIQSIAPIANRCVIFNTDPDSNHGHPDPLNTPDHITRKSIALYYYTASKSIHDEIEHSRTLYKARPSDSVKVKLMTKKRELRDRRKMRADKNGGFLSRLFSKK